LWSVAVGPDARAESNPDTVGAQSEADTPVASDTAITVDTHITADFWVAIAAPSEVAPSFADAHVDSADGWDDYLHEAGTAAHPPLNEISGIACSRTHPGVWWVHNDSGDEPRIFAIDAAGRLVMPAWQHERYFADEPAEGKQPWPGIPILGAANQDWEDLTLADGMLYISDMGNNGNAKRDLGVYLVSEPNPAAMDQGARPIRFIHIAYPDQHAYPPQAPDDWRFDCEAIFFHAGRLYFLTKYRADQRFDRITTGTSLYRLDTLHADRVNVLTLVHRADDLPIIPTSAELSPNGKRLAVLNHDAVWLYDTPTKGDDWLAGRAVRLPVSIKMGQAEGVCWDDDNTLRLVNEQRGVFTLDLSPLKPAD
jgi:hypothetical protein